MRIDPGKRDHYRVLGVPRDASMREIRRAYRRLARQHHPDISPHPGDSAYFTELTTAYEVLHDPAKRTRYDRSGYSLKAPGDSVQAVRPCWVEPDPAASWVRHPARPRRGKDLRAVLELSPREAAHLAVGPLTVRAGGHSIELAAGTRPGQQIRLAGAGEDWRAHVLRKMNSDLFAAAQRWQTNVLFGLNTEVVQADELAAIAPRDILGPFHTIGRSSRNDSAVTTVHEY